MSTLRVNTITPQSGSINQLSGSLLVIDALTVSGSSAFVNATFTQLLTGTTFSGSAATFSGNVTAATLTGTLQTAAQTNITSVGTLTSLTVSGDLTVDTSTLKVDSTNNRVGIGTATPGNTLHVIGGNAGQLLLDNGNQQFTQLLFQRNSTANTGGDILIDGTGTTFNFRSLAANMPFVWQLSTSAGSPSEKMRLDASGNLAVDTNTLYVDAANNRVGVGTATPGFALDATASGAVVGNFNRTTSSGATMAIQVVGSTVGTIGSDTGGNGRLDISSVSGGVAGNAIQFSRSGGTVSMLLDSSGNLAVDTNTLYVDAANNRVGVGTASPAVRLDIQGLGTASGYTAAGNAGLRVDFGTANNGVINMVGGGDLGVFRSNSSNAYDVGIGFGDNSNRHLTFTTANAERARITSGGYFKASNDGTYIDSTSNHHEFRATTSDNTIVYATHTHSTNPYGFRVRYTAATPNNTDNWFFYCDDSAAQRFSVRSNGGVYNYQANDSNLSDERVKIDIKPIGSYWDKFKAIEIVTFKYVDQTHDDDNIGVIAQQVETVAPEFINVDGFGETPEDGVPLKSVYTTDMYHASIKALQEAMARIETLEAHSAALEARLEALEA